MQFSQKGVSCPTRIPHLSQMIACTCGVFLQSPHPASMPFSIKAQLLPGPTWGHRTFINTSYHRILFSLDFHFALFVVPFPHWIDPFFWISCVNDLWWSLFVWSDVKLLSHIRLFVTPWTIAYQVPPSMGFSRQEYWSRLPFPFPGDLPNPWIEPGVSHMVDRLFTIWANREVFICGRVSKHS